MIPSFTLGVPMVPTSAPFLIVPSNPHNNIHNTSAFAHYTPSFPVPVDSNQNIRPTRVAHTNAHHLHSIPPAHKSTKSMILDHLLHLHAEARLAQVSAELGLTANEDDGRASSEHLCDALRYGAHVPSTPTRLMGATQGPSSRAAMARANGLEKVIGAMLDSEASKGSLPESVRFRIALSKVIDDLVAFRRVDSTSNSKQQQTPTIPSMLTSLSKPRRESSSSSPATSTIFASHSWAQPLGIVGSTLTREPSRSKELFGAGVGSASARCTRHLVQSCQTCATVPKASSSTSIGAGLTPRHLSTTPAGTLESIPHFLRLSALVCTQLSQSQQQQRQEQKQPDDAVSFGSTSSFGSSQSGTPHRASSAGDMPTPISEEDEQEMSDSPKRRSILPSLFARGGSPYLHHSRANSKRSMDIDQGEEDPITPTREWYALLAALLTRALLEGYLLHGWTGTHAAEVLFGVGLYDESKPKKKSNAKSSFFARKGPETTNPEGVEEVASMEEVGAVLFGSGAAFQEYVVEMEKRFAEFIAIKPQTPDLASHLEALVSPLEPIQTAALRFCEAVSQWKQTPELGNYKNNSTNTSSFSSRSYSNDYTSSPSIQSHSPVLHQTPTKQRVRLSPSISIASLIHPSSPPLSHPSTDSVSFLGLSNSGSLSSGITSESQRSLFLVPAPLNRFFTTVLGASTSSENESVSIGTKMKLGWAGLTLGAKRPREREAEESERAPKKAFLKGGMFNS